MPRTRPLFQFDAGWLYLVAGLVTCGAGILVPALDGLRMTEAQVSDLQAAEQHMVDRVHAYERFSDAVDRRDDELMRRLAAAQLNLMPEGEVPVFLCATHPAGITDWVERQVPPLPPRAGLAVEAGPPTLLRRLACGRYRLYFLGAGVFCVFLGLIIGSPTAPSRAAAEPGGGADPAGRRLDRDPEQLELFDTEDAAAVELAVAAAVVAMRGGGAGMDGAGAVECPPEVAMAGVRYADAPELLEVEEPLALDIAVAPDVDVDIDGGRAANCGPAIDARYDEDDEDEFDEDDDEEDDDLDDDDDDDDDEEDDEDDDVDDEEADDEDADVDDDEEEDDEDYEEDEDGDYDEDEDYDEDYDEDEDGDDEAYEGDGDDDEGDEERDAVDEEDVEYEYEYVDEDGNPIDPDELDGWEICEEGEDDGEDRDAAA